MSWTQQNGSGSRTWQYVASNSDGTKLVAVEQNGFIYTSTDSGVTWTQRDSSRSWTSVASSSDGIKLVAVVTGGYIYTSSDSGVNWIERTSAGVKNWYSVASSADGTKLAVIEYLSFIPLTFLYTSANSGVTWTQQNNANSTNWVSIASSSDGTKLVAVNKGEYIYTSTDSGVNWTQRMTDTNRNWIFVASSSDGTKLAAVVQNDGLYTSTDSGATWTLQSNAGSRNWISIASNSDGTKLVAAVDNGYIYISIDSGVTWVEQTSADSRNWLSVASNADGRKLAAVNRGGYIYTYAEPPPPLPCFKEGTKILTDQGYKAIEDLRKGDLIKTLKHGFLPVEILGKSQMIHNVSKERIKNQLYQCDKENYPDVLEPLIMTGCHSILVDWLTQEQGEKTVEDFGRIFMTDDKIRLMGFLDNKSVVYEVPGSYTIYHLALENEDYYGNYGIYANGLLVESCSKRYLLEHSNMTLIE